MTSLCALRRPFRPLAIATIVALAPMAPASAQLLRAQVDEATVGDWQCGDLRVYLTKLGSIEVLGEGYRPGLYRTAEGKMAIDWDDGTAESWGYAAGAGTLALTTGDGTDLSCVPRK